MSEQAERYQWVAAQFSKRVDEVAESAWDDPAPVEGWVARDVVGHLVEWLPAFFCATWGLEPPGGPSVADDPAGAWHALDALVQRAFADPAVADAERDTRMGSSTFAQTFDMIGTTDVFFHTWDLARATGLDETLDPDEVHRLLEGMEPMDQMLRESGQYGPRVPVPDDADEQTKLIAFLGRRP